MKKEIIQIQIAWFFSSNFSGSFEDISLKLKNKLGESKITQYLPIPDDAPNEIPRLILGYEKFNLNFSKNRLDLFVKDFESTGTIVDNINTVVLEQISLKVVRIGFVKKYFVYENIESLKKLLMEEKIKGLNFKELTIRVNINKIVEGHNCNSIESLSSGFIKEVAGRKEEGIMVIRDVNTIAEKIEDTNFNKEEIKKLIDSFEVESNSFILANFE